jgi:membrane protease YdiL (CAAX protease family)
MGKKLTWFVVSVLILSWALCSAVNFFDLDRNPLALLMAFPMIVALVLMRLSKDRLSAIGWKVPRVKHLLLAIGLPIGQMAIVVGAGLLLGLLSLSREHGAMSRPTSNVWLNLILYIPAMFVPFFLLSLPRFLTGWINHLGEEIAWRGFFFRNLAGQKTLTTAALVSGAVWWAWHIPMFWLSPVLTGLDPGRLILTLLLSFPALLGTGCVYCWIYVKSGSIWGPTVMHVFWNLYRAVLTGRLSDGEAGLFVGNLWLINGEGIIGMAVASLIGSVFFLLLRRSERDHGSHLRPR